MKVLYSLDKIRVVNVHDKMCNYSILNSSLKSSAVVDINVVDGKDDDSNVVFRNVDDGKISFVVVNGMSGCVIFSEFDDKDDIVFGVVFREVDGDSDDDGFVIEYFRVDGVIVLFEVDIIVVVVVIDGLRKTIILANPSRGFPIVLI